MLDLLQLPTLVVALLVMSWAVLRLSSVSLNSTSKASQNAFDVPPEVVRWQADLRRLSEELQSELDEKMSAVTTLSAAYEQASERLSDLIERAEELEEELVEKALRRLSA
jgi:biopolymer transport protein ExbB/TolQ